MPAYAAAAAAVVGAALQATGTVTDVMSKQAAAKYQAQIAKNNQIIAEQNAGYAARAGAQKVATRGLLSANIGGKIKAGQAANNVDVNSGSAVSVQKGQREAGRLDELTVENNALLEAYGYRTQAAEDQAVSTLKSNEASGEAAAGYLSAGGSLLENASSLGAKWGSMTGSGGGGGDSYNYAGSDTAPAVG